MKSRAEIIYGMRFHGGPEKGPLAHPTVHDRKGGKGKGATKTIVKRGPNFAHDGEYNVTLPNGHKTIIYRDQGTGWWFEVVPYLKDSSTIHRNNEDLIGFNKAEAIAELEKKQGL